MSAPGLPISPDDERELATALAWAAASRAVPEELVLFSETAADYWADPSAILRPARRGEAVGFGIDVAMMTPLLLAICTPVVQYLAAQIGNAVKDRAGPRVAAVMRRMFGLRRADDPARVPPLSGEQVAQVRLIANHHALALGLSPQRAGLLADAVAGGALANSAPQG